MSNKTPSGLSDGGLQFESSTPLAAQDHSEIPRMFDSDFSTPVAISRPQGVSRQLISSDSPETKRRRLNDLKGESSSILPLRKPGAKVISILSPKDSHLTNEGQAQRNQTGQNQVVGGKDSGSIRFTTPAQQSIAHNLKRRPIEGSSHHELESIWLCRSRQRFTSSAESDVSCAQHSCVTETEMSKTIRLVFSDQSVGLIVARYLKSSEVRGLISVLHDKNDPVVGYFEMLCRRLLNDDQLKTLLEKYLKRIPTPQMNSKSSLDERDDNGDEGRGVGTSVALEVIDIQERSSDDGMATDTDMSIFERIYRSELLGKYCDECSMPRIEEDNNTLPKPTVKQDTVDDQSVSLTVFLCETCNLRLTPRFKVTAEIDDIEENRDILIQCKFLKLENAILQYDHCCTHTILHSIVRTYNVISVSGGTYISSWPTIKKQYDAARMRFISALRENFAKRISRRFGQGFYQTFVHKILPPSEFLKKDAIAKKYLCIQKSKATTRTGRQSRFKDAPMIDRYPQGSLERSAALLIEDLFEIWNTETDNIRRLVAAEVAMIAKFALAHDITSHTDHPRAASLVEDYVLTRTMNRAKFDRMFVPLLWRVLHRGISRKPRTFTASMEDRQRIDKFFATCSEGPPPVMHVKGYIGFPAEDDLVSEAGHTTPLVLKQPEGEQQIIHDTTTSPIPPARNSALERLQAALQKKFISSSN